MILLATCYYQLNYGSKLQAYATQAILDKLGIENRTINCELINGYLNRKKVKYYLRNIKKCDVFLAQIQRYLFQFVLAKKCDLKRGIKLRYTALKNFENNFKLTEPYKFSELKKMVMDYSADIVVVGSDQLWLPSNIYADYYTLNWVPDGIKRVSFATSFGVKVLDKNTSEVAKTFLEKLDTISVREKNGEIIVSKLVDKPVMKICDPVMLFDAEEWKNLLNMQDIEIEPYIFCYFLGDNAWHREWAKKLREITGLKIITLICLEKYIKSDFNYADETLFDVTPKQFVNLIANAKYVCTDSFHGTLFSVLFHRQFFVFRRFRKIYRGSTNDRIDSLLSLLQLENQIVVNAIEPYQLIEKVIEYESIDKKVEKFRKESFEWIKVALGGN